MNGYKDITGDAVKAAARPPHSKQLEIFGDGGYEALGESFGYAIDGGILLFEEAFYVGGDFIFVAEDEFVGVKENFLSFPVGQSNFAADSEEHGGGGAGFSVEEERDGFERHDFAAQEGVAGVGVGGNFVGRDGEKFAHYGGGEFLVGAIAVGVVFEGGNGDDVNRFWVRIRGAGNVVAASGKIAAACQQKRKSRSAKLCTATKKEI